MSTTATASPATTILTAFIHFTSRVDAEAMVAAGIIGLSRMIVDAVYAVAVGGESVPAIQHGGGAGINGATGGREVAILFTTNIAPDTIWADEVIWHRDTDLPITDALIIDAADAIAALDNSAGLPGC